jgi:DNA topoisomerase-3
VQHAKTKKPIQRLWLQSMTQSAIREGFEKLRADRDMLALADAAKSRSEADWLVGINGTRAMTAFNSKEGGFYLTTVGRVPDPTLAILVEREEKILRSSRATIGKSTPDSARRPASMPAAGSTRASRRTTTRAQGRAALGAPKAERSSPRAAARPASHRGIEALDAAVAAALRPHQPAARSQRPLRFPARMTLSLAQALYEKHKVLTYPRTDRARCPRTTAHGQEDAGSARRTRVRAVRQADPQAGLGEAEQAHLRQQQDLGPLRDHSDAADAEASERAEQKLYDLVVRRFLAVFYPAAEFLQTTRITRVGEHQFKTEGKVLQNPAGSRSTAAPAARRTRTCRRSTPTRR